MSTMDAEGAGENLESSDNNRDANNEQGEGAIGFSHPPASTSASNHQIIHYTLLGIFDVTLLLLSLSVEERSYLIKL